MGFDDKEMLKKMLKSLVENNDASVLIVGNYVDFNEEHLEMEYAVSADEEELFEILIQLFKNETFRAQARKAILHIDYGNSEIDNLNIN
tara:strand:- start:11182 stop:11448 length:267 start_codon:yes stop_codon:yes gene_type:complete